MNEFPKTLYIQEYSFGHLKWDTYRHNDDDVEYIRKDIHDEQVYVLKVENEQLKETLEKFF